MFILATVRDNTMTESFVFRCRKAKFLSVYIKLVLEVARGLKQVTIVFEFFCLS